MSNAVNVPVLTVLPTTSERLRFTFPHIWLTSSRNESIESAESPSSSPSKGAPRTVSTRTFAVSFLAIKKEAPSIPLEKVVWARQMAAGSMAAASSSFEKEAILGSETSISAPSIIPSVSLSTSGSFWKTPETTSYCGPSSPSGANGNVKNAASSVISSPTFAASRLPLLRFSRHSSPRGERSLLSNRACYLCSHRSSHSRQVSFNRRIQAVSYSLPTSPISPFPRPQTGAICASRFLRLS